MRGSALDRLGWFPRSSVGFRAATLQHSRLQQDRVKRIPQVMRDDAEHVISQLRGID
jgi:hypothetical protein